MIKSLFYLSKFQFLSYINYSYSKLIIPIVTRITLSLAIVLITHQKIDYEQILYIAIGLSTWQFLSSSIIRNSNNIKYLRAVCSKSDLNSLLINFYIVMGNFFLFFIEISILYIFVYLYKPNIYIANIVCSLPILFIYVYLTSIIIQYLSLFIFNLQLYVESILRFIFFISPIIWFEPQFSSIIFDINPITSLLRIMRSPLVIEYNINIIFIFNYIFLFLFLFIYIKKKLFLLLHKKNFE